MRIRVGVTPVPPTCIDIFFRSKQFRNTSSAILPKIENLNEIYPHAPRPLVPRVPHASVLPSNASVHPPHFPTLDDVSPRSMMFPHARWCFHTLDGCFHTLDGCFHTLDGCFPTIDGCFHTLDGCLPKRTRTRGTRSFVVSVDLDMGYILQEILKIYKNFFYFFENFSKKKVLKKIIFFILEF